MSFYSILEKSQSHEIKRLSGHKCKCQECWTARPIFLDFDSLHVPPRKTPRLEGKNGCKKLKYDLSIFCRHFCSPWWWPIWIHKWWPNVFEKWDIFESRQHHVCEPFEISWSPVDQRENWDNPCVRCRLQPIWEPREMSWSPFWPAKNVRHPLCPSVQPEGLCATGRVVFFGKMPDPY